MMTIAARVSACRRRDACVRLAGLDTSPYRDAPVAPMASVAVTPVLPLLD